MVTARAVAPLERLLGWCMPLVAPDGVLLAMKGSGAADEVAGAAARLDELGCARPELLDLGAGRVGGAGAGGPGGLGRSRAGRLAPPRRRIDVPGRAGALRR